MEKEFFPWKKDGLTGLGIKPARSDVKKMIVLLHGYMGDAESNMAFASKLAEACPNAVVLVPDGVEPVPPANDPTHRQWYPLPETADEDGYMYAFMTRYAPAEKRRQIKESSPLVQKTAERLNRLVSGFRRKYGLKLSDCFLAGISQGGITAFDMVLFRKELHCDETGCFLGGLIIIGAGINDADRLDDITACPPIPVLLARGKRDGIFPKTVDCFSAARLRLLKMPVETTQADSEHFGLEHKVCDAVCRFIRQYS